MDTIRYFHPFVKGESQKNLMKVKLFIKKVKPYKKPLRRVFRKGSMVIFRS